MNAIFPHCHQSSFLQVCLCGLRHRDTLDIIFIFKYLYYITKLVLMQGFKTISSRQKEIPMSTKQGTKKSAKSSAASRKAKKGLLSAEEIAAMKETLKERKVAASKEEEERLAVEAIAAMKEPDRSMAKRIHAIIKDVAPGLSPKTWYGMPAYANNDGKVVCFFQTGQKFKTRYSTFGFNDSANLDEGEMWPVAFALKELSAAEEAKIAALVKKAAGTRRRSIRWCGKCWRPS